MSEHHHQRYKKSQRRKEIDELNKCKDFKVFNIEPEVFQVLLEPSDPDFPFQIPVLDFDLMLPLHYPHKGDVRIKVNNENIPRGVGINIENGFPQEGTLVQRIKELDKNLEKFVLMKPANTIRIVKGGPKTQIKVVPNTNQGVKRDDIVPLPTPQIEPLSINAGDDDTDAESDTDEYIHSSDEEDVDAGPSNSNSANLKPKREGTELLFDNIELQNIALCEIISLNILFQCGRCKTTLEFKNLQSAEYGHPSKPQAILCSRCDLPLMVAFRKEYLHSMSHTAGYLDITGGKPLDLMPSSYVAMCAECQEPSPVLKTVDLGSLRIMFCRNCHTKMTMKIEMFSFVLLSTETLEKKDVKTKKLQQPQKQNLNLTGGEPLPKNGICEHYRKSTRWFRFRCCQRVFPCDKCHDLEMQHLAEQASRMLCGFCSREQRFNDKCVYCQHDYTNRRTVFWEGGKGVRDRKLMSRKDKRKFKRDPVEKQKKSVHFKGKSNKSKESSSEA